jgi:hypothetical protein
VKIEVNMTTSADMFEVVQWWAKSPDFALKALRAQLEAAQVIWPEQLQGYEIGRRGKRTAGEAGGHARAEALSSERRSEIASEAAKARWGDKGAA